MTTKSVLTKPKVAIPDKRLTLTGNIHRLFQIQFGTELCNGWCLKSIDNDTNKQKKLMKFLVKSVNKNWNELQWCKIDKKENHKLGKVEHLKIDNKARLHGVVEGSVFHVTKIDMDHKVHK